MTPERFFDEAITVGEQKGAILTNDQFEAMIDEFYTQRGRDLKTSKPGSEKLESLGLAA